MDMGEVLEAIGERYEIVEAVFCPDSGFRDEMTLEQAERLGACVRVGKCACATHGYDPDGELPA